MIVQLSNVDGNHAGLYATERTDVDNFQGAFDAAFEYASMMSAQDDEYNTHEGADGILEGVGFTRVFAEEVTTEKI